MNENDFAELAAGYAFNALSPADLATFEVAREQHPEWEHWIEGDLRAVSELADGVAPAAPPLAMRSKLLAQIALTPQGDSPEGVPALGAARAQDDDLEPDAEPDSIFIEPAPTTTTIQAIERRKWTRGLFALAASLVLLVALGLGAATIGELIGPSTAVVALEQIEQAPDAQQASVDVADGGTATLHWSESVSKVVLVSDGLPSLSEDQDFELWLIRGDEAPMAAGTFDAGNGSSATAELDGQMQPGDTIAVTVEEAGGSPTGEPTSDPIIIIPTA
ncbi:anti-sigma factor (plasmid) [Coraliomargarita sp. W4R53]